MSRVLIQRDSQAKRTYIQDKTSGICFTTECIAKAPSFTSIILVMPLMFVLPYGFYLYVVLKESNLILLCECISVFLCVFIHLRLEHRVFLKSCDVCEVVKGADHLKSDMKLRYKAYISNVVMVVVVTAPIIYYIPVIELDINMRLLFFSLFNSLTLFLAINLDKCLHVYVSNFTDSVRARALIR